jgi:membrane-associated phospholipid phosphatase
VDWTVFHLLNGPLRGDDPAQDAAEIFNAWALFALGAAVVVVWFLARPGGSLRSKRATVSATLAAGLALVVNSILGHLWYHPRPFVDHPSQTVLLVRHGADNSFPSDHASVAFAIAFAVLALHRRLGLLFLVAAALIGVDRIFVGVHYPVDVAASILVGAGCALLVTTLGRSTVDAIVRWVSRVSDPLVLATARALATARRSFRR